MIEARIPAPTRWFFVDNPDTTSPETVVNDLFNALSEGMAHHPQGLGMSAKWLRDTKRDLYSLLRPGTKERSPYEMFDYEAQGTYKVVYNFGNIMMKLCANDNPTGDEYNVLKAADYYGITAIFCPTWFLQLPEEIEDILTDEDPEQEPYPEVYGFPGNATPTKYDCIEFQPLVHKCDSYAKPGRTPYDDVNLCSGSGQAYYEENPLRFPSSGKTIPYNVLAMASIETRSWLQDALDYYGEPFMRNFFEFLEQYGVMDLHSDNVGYLWRPNEDPAFQWQPVIIDWFSRPITDIFDEED